MRSLLLGLTASALACSAMAQSYDDDRNGYDGPGYQDQGRYYDQGRTYDQGRDDDRGDWRTYDRGYRYDRRGDDGDRWASGVQQGAHLTSRVGNSWRDADGRWCSYRELTWTDSDGYQAYKWVPYCG